MSDAFDWDEDDADFNPASSRDDVIYMGKRKYIAEDQTAARIRQLEAEREGFREALATACGNAIVERDAAYRRGLEDAIEAAETMLATYAAAETKARSKSAGLVSGGAASAALDIADAIRALAMKEQSSE